MHAAETGTLPDVSAVHLFLELTRALTSELSGHNRALCELDVAEVEKRLMTEREICAELGCLFQMGTMRSFERMACETGSPLKTSERSRLLWKDVRTAAGELSAVLRTHAALALRSRRSMHALANVLCTSGGPTSGTCSGAQSFSASYGA